MGQAPVPGPARRAAEVFAEREGRAPEAVFFSPGRVNLIGEHTDYNEGFVLPLALPYGVGVAVAPREDAVLRLHSTAAGPAEVALADLAPGGVTGWAAYPAGTAWALREDAVPVGGADMVVDSDVPQGAGLSSSHALQCAVGLALLALAGREVTTAEERTHLARLVMRSENDFVGAPTGIMDQMASLHGRADHLVFLDTRSLAVRHVPWRLSEHGLALLVVDTQTPHALVDGEYAARREACAEGARLLGVPALRDVTDPADAGRLDDEVVRRRVRHVVTEDARVLSVCGLLDEGADPRRVGALLTASHVSMRDDFEITVPTVDTAVEAALAAGAHGARMTGGGFGGSVVALVEADAAATVADAVASAFATAGFDAPRSFVVEAADGGRRITTV